MKEAKHTPGPWRVHRHPHINNELWLSVLSGAWDITHNYASRPGVVADARYSAMSDAENEANARLIAAAPDLLAAALTAFDATKDAPHGGPTWTAHERLRAAITKATGE